MDAKPLYADPMETDPFTGEARLCVDGKMASGDWACTGSAHVGGAHLRCTDSSHTFPRLMLDGVPIDCLPSGLIVGPATTSPPPGEDPVAAAIRRSQQSETMGR